MWLVRYTHPMCFDLLQVSDGTEVNGGNGKIIKVMGASANPPPDYPTVVVSNNVSGSAPTDAALAHILAILKDFQESHLASNREESCRRDWMLVAMVIDRFLLVVFFFLTVIVTSVILTSHPTYVDGVYDPV